MKTMTITIKPSDLILRNEMHFDVQRRNRAQVFKNRKKYDRNVDKRTYRKDY